MEFKYEMKGNGGTELFEDCVLMARQYLGVGDWQVWDLRPNAGRNCKQCSSRAERLVSHDRYNLCPGTDRGGGERIARARDAIAKRDARVRDAQIASVVRRAQELDNEEAEGEDAEEPEAERHEEEAEGAEEAYDDRAVVEEEVHLNVLFLINHFLPLICPQALPSAPRSDEDEGEVERSDLVGEADEGDWKAAGPEEHAQSMVLHLVIYSFPPLFSLGTAIRASPDRTGGPDKHRWPSERDCQRAGPCCGHPREAS
jgi:hypothetical protein